MLTLSVPLLHIETGKYFAAYTLNKIQKSMKLHTVIWLEHFKVLYLSICIYSCICFFKSVLMYCIMCSFIVGFFNTGLAWKSLRLPFWINYLIIIVLLHKEVICCILERNRQQQSTWLLLSFHVCCSLDIAQSSMKYECSTSSLLYWHKKDMSHHYLIPGA